MYKILYVFMILPVLFCSQIILIENLFCGTYTITIYKDSRIIILSQPENTEISYYLKDIFKGANIILHIWFIEMKMYKTVFKMDFG